MMRRVKLVQIPYGKGGFAANELPDATKKWIKNAFELA
jgi:hypothetical protein